jgi:hypothetical protein
LFEENHAMKMKMKKKVIHGKCGRRFTFEFG